MDTYRLVLQIDAPDQKYATGATYNGCSRVTNPTACDPQGFMTLDAVIGYAKAHNEIPIRVDSVEQVDGILAGTIPVTPDMIITESSGGGFLGDIPMPVLIGGGLLLLMVFSKRKKHGTN